MLVVEAVRERGVVEADDRDAILMGDEMRRLQALARGLPEDASWTQVRMHPRCEHSMFASVFGGSP